MARKLVLAVLFASVLFAGCQTGQGQAATCADEGWIRLFDGTPNSWKGWKASENKDTFTTRDGMIVAQGPRSHLFYAGPVENANFTNFEFKADVMTEPGSNSGIYFHTKYQETGWPSKGYEVQVNNTHKDPKKTGGLYAVKDVFDAPAKDNEWFNQHIIVQGKNITIKVNGKTMVEYTEPEEVGRSGAGRKISSGTFALQGHDPKSIVYYKNIMVKPLPCGPEAKPKPKAKEQPKAPIKIVVVTGGHRFEHEPFFSVFKGHDDIKYVEALQKDHSEIFEDISKWDYDVIVLYNMTQKISPQRRKNFISLLNRGVGLVVLHHAMGAFQSWPGYKKISGGKYYTKATEEGGVERPGSTFKHDEDMKIHIANSKHPITRGMSDFEIHDETYKNCGHQKNNQVLLTTDHPNNDKTIAWVRRYGKAKVCGIQLGHDGKAYANPNYRRLVAQAIRWTAGRLN